MLQLSIIQPLSSSWSLVSSPLNMVPEKIAGDWPHYGYYCALNFCIIPTTIQYHAYTIFTSLLQSAFIFSKLDLVCAYYQLPDTPTDVP